MTGGNVPIRGEASRLIKGDWLQNTSPSRRQQFSDDSAIQIIVFQTLGASRLWKREND
jgi:hypothetical protein